MRRWVVGDLHGCARELDRLLREVRFDPATDELWSVGDLVNTGPDSLATLRLWRDAGGHAVLGNHDVYALRARAGRRRRKPDTLDELFAAEDGDRLLERLRAQPVLARLDGDDGCDAVWVVHAGLHPRWEDLAELSRRVNEVPHDDEWLVDPRVTFATRVRCCTVDGRMSDETGPPARCTGPFRPWDDLYDGSELVVHGHWAQRGFYRTERTLGLDSGCVYGGWLTAWCQQEDRLVRVRSQGRNR